MNRETNAGYTRRYQLDFFKRTNFMRTKMLKLVKK